MIGRTRVSRAPLTLLILPLLLAGVSFGCGKKKEPEYKQADYAEVVRGDLALVVKATGTIEPKEITRLKSEASGKILQLNVKEGDRVAAGETIAVLDQWRQELARDRAAIGVQQSQHQLAELKRGANVSAIRNAETAVRNAEIELENAQTNQRRVSELYGQGFSSKREMEDADRAVELAQVALDRARKDLQQLKTQGNPDAMRAAELALQQSSVALLEANREVGNASLNSPIAGTILEKFVSEGDTVIGTNNGFGEGTTLVSLADLTRVQVRTSVDEVDIGRVKAGLPAEVTVDAYPGEVFKGSVTNIFPQGIAEAGVTSFQVIVDVPNEEGKLLSNMTASVNITAQTVEKVLLAPFESIRSDKEGNPIVYVPGEGLKPEERPVKLGATDFNNVEILEGLKDGEQIMIDNLPQEAEVSLGAEFEG